MNQYLRTYQQEGVLFLYQHYVSGTGSLLCDDIGLGKTVQVIAFMTAILEKTGTQKDLLSAESKEVQYPSEITKQYTSSYIYNFIKVYVL